MAFETDRRFYCPDLAKGMMTLPAAEARHALKSLRLKTGDRVALFNGLGLKGEGIITDLNSRSVEVDVDSLEAVTFSCPRIHLAVSLPKSRRMDWLAEKTAELGVCSFRPVIFNRSVAGKTRFSMGRRDRCVKRFISAAKQCALDCLPELREPLKPGQLVGRADSGRVIFGDIDGVPVSVPEALKG